ncbi:BamA/TamA family outer membrane protein [Oscillatoria sp. FACHB-1407]|uniref:BamA/TamA family outer membrane protein n=1 Tax=Oscillatoria sp. FACHB-1407 TaxID=2692847 RepID=UPI001689AA17|nr:BamA/TamA family outer membrane protein [Oscillatoria sp. FACHB-1407]MBD2464791.1 BamA/TamA family outer membrane protein [Oscillatoria sp. FACHB-1407]
MRVSAVASLIVAIGLGGIVPEAVASVLNPTLADTVTRPMPHAGSTPSHRISQAQPNSIYYYQDYQEAPAQPTATATPNATTSDTTGFPSPGSTPSPSTSGSVTPTVDFPRPVVVPISPASPPIAPAPSTPVAPLTTSDLAVTTLSVRVQGADAELQQLVLQSIQTRPGGATSQSQLQRDVNTILNTGLFANATVLSYARQEGVDVLFTVEPVVVRSLQLNGARVLSPTTVNEIFQAQLGQPISPNALRQGVEQINQWYADNGYTLAQVIALRPDRNGVITINVAEGVIARVNIRFLNAEGSPTDEQGQPIQSRTQESFIRREVQLQPGQIFNETTAQEDLQRLFRLGVFDRADIALAGDPQAVDVTYNLIERPSRSINLGGGYSDQAGLFGTITYQDNNIGGIGQRLGGNLQVGTRDFQFDVNFTSPYRESAPDRLGYQVNAFRRRILSPTFTREVRLPNGDIAREGRFGAGVSVMRPIGEWDAELGLNYTRVSIRDGSGDIATEDELGNPLTVSGEGADDLTTLSFEVTQDRRNNLVNPSDGSVLSLRTEQSIPIGQGTILLNRLQANYTRYFPVNLLDAGTPEEPEVLAFNVQGGTIFGDAPPYYSFNLGGGNSVRGYREGRVGTGRRYVLASAEYRFPIFRPVGGVFFADFASDLGSGDEVLGEPAIARDKPGTGFGYGFGVRIMTPIGLLRGDYGFNDEGESRFFFGIGQRF